MRSDFRTPQMQRLGQVPTRGLAPQASAVPRGATRSLERALNYQFTPLRVLNFSARQIPPCGVAIPVGQTAWFGIAKWTVGQDLPQSTMNGFRVETGGTNPDPAGDDDFVTASPLSDLTAWGNGDGFGAAIAIGVNVRFSQLGQWTAGPAYVPYVNEGPTKGQNWNSTSEGEIFYVHFAPGKQSDRPRPVAARLVQTTPLAFTLNPGDELSVSFIGRGAEVVNPSLYGLIMRVYGDIYLSSLIAPRGITQ
jgi:hypothetical protein